MKPAEAMPPNLALTHPNIAYRAIACRSDMLAAAGPGDILSLPFSADCRIAQLRSQEMQVTFLGSGDAFGSGGRFNTCFLVEAAAASFLIDCGASSLIA